MYSLKGSGETKMEQYKYQLTQKKTEKEEQRNNNNKNKGHTEIKSKCKLSSTVPATTLNINRLNTQIKRTIFPEWLL